MRSTFQRARRRLSPAGGQRSIAFLTLVALVAALVGQHVFAAEPGKTIMLGESLTDVQREELLRVFDAGSDDRIDVVTIKETQDAMKGIISNPASSAYSSTALTCRDLGDGLEVSTRNITVITPSLYAIALVTAGLGDGRLLVAAPNDAPAQGMTALTGIFKTWEIAPCDSGNPTKARQRLALEELAVAVEIGQAVGGADGMTIAGNLVLFTQQAVVIEGLTEAGEISDAIANQEIALGVQIPDDLRNKLIDLMVRLAAEEIDWSTFSAGWTITETDDRTGISMKGDGIAIRNAQATATARAAEQQTATARAAAKQTAAAGEEAANLTATAQAELDARAAADARATEDALSAAMTATAAAQPTETPTPQLSPTATPAPIAMSGTISDVGGGQVQIEPNGGGEPIAYSVPVNATISRDGEITTLSSLKKGDSVSVVVDASSLTVRELSASAASAGIMSQLGRFLFIVPALAAIPLILLLRGRVGGGAGDAFVVKRVASA